MKAHLAYLKYVMRHKWFVFLACMKLGVPLWRAIIHDWDKFLPEMWLPFVSTFYAPDGSKRYQETPAFALAWNGHQKRNKHHWQYWLLTWDRGETVALEMPMEHVIEMVADWIGAGQAIKGRTDPRPWYEANKTKMILHSATRAKVDAMLADLRTQ